MYPDFDSDLEMVESVVVHQWQTVLYPLAECQYLNLLKEYQFAQNLFQNLYPDWMYLVNFVRQYLSERSL